jgi:hypothetical protein
MVRTLSRKTYPMVRWFLLASAAVVAVGLVAAGAFRNLDDPQAYAIDTTTLLLFVAGAAVLPFIALLFPRRETLEIRLPSDRLNEASRTELQGILQSLDDARAKGEIDDRRYENAKSKVLAQMGGKK